MGDCVRCAELGTVEKLLELLGISEGLAKDLHTNHYCWEKEKDHEDKERLRKVEKRQVALFEIIQQLHAQLKPFKVHMLVKQYQEVEFNRLRVCSQDNHVLLQFDFSENAEIQEQDGSADCSLVASSSVLVHSLRLGQRRSELFRGGH